MKKKAAGEAYREASSSPARHLLGARFAHGGDDFLIVPQTRLAKEIRMSLRTLFDALKPGQSYRRRQPRNRQFAVEGLECRNMLAAASLTLSDVAIIEGNDGTRSAAAVVSLSAPQKHAVTAKYNTSHGNALAGSDFRAVSGKVTFAPGQTSKSILVPVIGDRRGEWTKLSSLGCTTPHAQNRRWPRNCHDFGRRTAHQH